MIGTIDIRVNAAKPNFPLSPFYAFINSPSQVRIINVPKAIGEWEITKVYITANYPDNQSASVECSLDGGCWHGTLGASTATGSSTNGFTITADGVKEDGTTAVTGYVLGKGDLYILATDGTITVGETTYYIHLVDSQPSSPKRGDLCVIDGVWKIYTGSAWSALGSAVSIDWSAITNKPTSFAPTSHASTHATGGTDAITPANIGAIANPSGGETGNVLKKTATGAEWAAESGGTVTDVQVDGTSVVSGGVANIAKATASSLGVVKPDGTTITIDGDGKISSTATGGVTSITAGANVSVSAATGAVTVSVPNVVSTTATTAQSIASQLSVESLYVGGTKVEVVSSAPASPVADTLYFITGS